MRIIATKNATQHIASHLHGGLTTVTIQDFYKQVGQPTEFTLGFITTEELKGMRAIQDFKNGMNARSQNSYVVLINISGKEEFNDYVNEAYMGVNKSKIRTLINHTVTALNKMLAVEDEEVEEVEEEYVEDEVQEEYRPTQQSFETEEETEEYEYTYEDEEEYSEDDFINEPYNTPEEDSDEDRDLVARIKKADKLSVLADLSNNLKHSEYIREELNKVTSYRDINTALESYTIEVSAIMGRDDLAMNEKLQVVKNMTDDLATNSTVFTSAVVSNVSHIINTLIGKFNEKVDELVEEKTKELNDSMNTELIKTNKGLIQFSNLNTRKIIEVHTAEKEVDSIADSMVEFLNKLLLELDKMTTPTINNEKLNTLLKIQYGDDNIVSNEVVNKFKELINLTLTVEDNAIKNSDKLAILLNKLYSAVNYTEDQRQLLQSVNKFLTHNSIESTVISDAIRNMNIRVFLADGSPFSFLVPLFNGYDISRGLSNCTIYVRDKECLRYYESIGVPVFKDLLDLQTLNIINATNPNFDIIKHVTENRGRVGSHIVVESIDNFKSKSNSDLFNNVMSINFLVSNNPVSIKKVKQLYKELNHTMPKRFICSNDLNIKLLSDRLGITTTTELDTINIRTCPDFTSKVSNLVLNDVEFVDIMNIIYQSNIKHVHF